MARGPAAYPVLAKVFGVLGLAFWAAAGGYGALRHHTLSRYARTEGTVMLLRHSGRGYRPAVQFTPPGGAPVRFESFIGSSPPAYHVGDIVPVLYAPDDPRTAVIDDAIDRWFFTLLFAVIGAPLLAVGAALSLAARGRRPAAGLGP